ncbi:MAG: MotA/TolQ/ExbB proton channel family protein [Candidatus Omnitrophota bacterium]
MNPLYFFVGEFILLLVIAATLWFGGTISIFIDWPSLIFILVGCPATLLMSFSPQEIAAAFRHAVGGEWDLDEQRRSAYIWECAVRNLLLLGAVGTIIGLVQMLQNLMDPSQIGPAMCAAVITFLYGVVFSIVFPIPALYAIKKRIQDSSIEEN